MDNKYCVYCHTNKINGKKYIGITSQKPTKRWGVDGKKYHDCPKFYNAIQKYGWDNFYHDILFTNLSKNEACEKEVELIELYNTNDKNCGYNITSGGDCPSIADETKEKIRKIKIGHRTSEETKRKMSIAKLGENHPRARKIICINTFETYDTATQASIETGVNDNNILSCCKGKLKSAGKMPNGEPIIWKYYDEYNNNEVYTYCNGVSKTIICLETYEIFYSQIDACKKYNISDRSLNDHLKGRKSFAGRDKITKMPLHWMYYDEYKKSSKEEIQNRTNKTLLRYSSIICINDLNIFESPKDVVNFYKIDNISSVINCCKNKQNYVVADNKKYQFMYYIKYLKEAV